MQRFRGLPRKQTRYPRKPAVPSQRSPGLLRCLRPRQLAAAAAGLTFAAGSADAHAPLSYLESFGSRADAINALMWFLIAISLSVIALTIVLLLGAIFRGCMRSSDILPGVVPLVRGRGGATWIAVGVGLTVLTLLASSVWTVVTLANVSLPPRGKETLRLQVVGHQWWW